MQPFARPVVRVVWGHARLGFDRAAARPGLSFGGRKVQTPAACFRLRAIGPSTRLYSSQIPPKDQDPSSNTTPSEKGVEPESEKSTPSPDERNTLPDSPEAEAKSTPTPEQSPSTWEARRHDATQKFSLFMDNLQSRILTATHTLNDITGYTGIEAIKRQNAVLEVDLADAHERVRNARQAYKTSNTKRATTQREVTTLLARKDSWSPVDLERFTELYRADHVLEGEVTTSQQMLTEAEADEQSLSQRLNAGILKRYHEEQIWSDRIRRASTWGTWGLMGMNFLLFVVLQFVAEPWKRRRLVKGVVAEEKAVLEEVRGQLEEVKLALQKRHEVTAFEPIETPIEAAIEAVEIAEEAQAAAEGTLEESLVEAAIETPEATPEAVEAATPESIPEPAPEKVEEILPASISEPVLGTPAMDAKWEDWKEFLLDPARWRVFAEDLYSERRIDLRMRDASLLALQGAAAGAVVAGSIVLLVVRRS